MSSSGWRKSFKPKGSSFTRPSTKTPGSLLQSSTVKQNTSTATSGNLPQQIPVKSENFKVGKSDIKTRKGFHSISKKKNVDTEKKQTEELGRSTADQGNGENQETSIALSTQGSISVLPAPTVEPPPPEPSLTPIGPQIVKPTVAPVTKLIDTSVPSVIGPRPAPASQNTSRVMESTEPESNALTVVRQRAGMTWHDPTLLAWDPSHFRLFVGNLSNDVTEEMLKTAFTKDNRYPSLSKVRVVCDSKPPFKPKGYGFVSFGSSDDYFKAFKEMNGKYVGNHPIQLKKANTEIKPVVVSKNSGHRKNNRRR